MDTPTLYTTTFFEVSLAIALLLPLLSFIVAGSISQKYAWTASFVSALLLLISTVSAGYLFVSIWNNPPFLLQWKWFSVNNASFSIGLLIDNIAVLMMLVVLVISFLVHLYSAGYMAGDSGITRYFAMLGFFTFAMLGIVVSDNLLLIFVFWELVGFSSYMLIGHWQEKPEASHAAKKAFIFNRIGDAGFLIGLMLLWTYTGTFDITLLASADAFTWQTAASLCIFCGVIGKSAQFPLLSWLPDAMEGPTPVSALIHAATMVAAGVFLLARIDFLFTPDALTVITIVGIITALMAALSALAQSDIKKVLAYSTISQLGLMVTAIGAGSSAAAMLHLFTHAFFKACLFLSAGAVIHALHQAQQQAHSHFDVQDINNLGGLRKKMPVTFIAFIISGGALGGLPFFSGFISKDAILTSLFLRAQDGPPWNWIVLTGAFAVSFITVIYTFRLIATVFLGEEKYTQSMTITEPPIVMRIPVILLATGSVWLMVSVNPFGFQGWLFKALNHTDHFYVGFMSWLSAAWVILALATAWVFFQRKISLRSSFLKNGFALDSLYHHVFAKTTSRLTTLVDTLDRKWIDGFIHASAYIQVTVAHATGLFDRLIVDGSVNGAAFVARGIGSLTRSFQGGKIQLYIVWSILTIIIFLIWSLF